MKKIALIIGSMIAGGIISANRHQVRYIKKFR